MYVIQSNACTEPNSATPMTAARIAAQNRRVGRVGSRFVRGNTVMAGLVNGLTPPVPDGSCSDFTNSNALWILTPFPIPVPPGATVTPGTVDTGAAVPGSDAAAALAEVMAAVAPPGSSVAIAAPSNGGSVSPAGSVATAPPVAATVGSGAPVPTVGGGVAATNWRGALVRPRGGVLAAPGANDPRRGYSGRYPYGAIVDALSSSWLPGYSCPASQPDAVAANSASAAAAAAASSPWLWGALILGGLLFAYGGNGGNK
jgi:hypothetical protein